MTVPQASVAPSSTLVHALIIGMGSIGQRHARNLRRLLGDRVRLSAYRARRQSPIVGERLTAHTMRSVEEEYELETFHSLDDALASSPDVAFICNPTSLHLETAIACASAGCDLFIEKPIADSLNGLDRLVSLVEAKRLVVAVGCQLRFHPALRLMKQRLEDAVGAPLAVRAEVGEYLPGWHPYEDYRRGYAARRDLGGGVILTLIHEIDYLTWLFGNPRRVFAVGGHLSSLEVDVEDVASILAHHEYAGRTLPVHLQLDFVRRPPRRTCAVLSEAGGLDVDLRQNRLTHTAVDGTVTTVYDDPTFDRNALFVAELSDFLNAQATRNAPEVTLEAGIGALRVALAALESIRTQSVVELR